jgi:hypothetical protein
MDDMGGGVGKNNMIETYVGLQNDIFTNDDRDKHRTWMFVVIK